MPTYLLTGAAGFIGSHTCVALLEAGHEVVAIDNFANSHADVYERVEQITGRSVKHYDFDVRDRSQLAAVFGRHQIDGVIHFAGLKAVGESVERPWEYYEVNLGSTMTLISVMREQDCFNLVFSSSATVYGESKILPIPESAPLSASNPYGRSKLIIEDMLRDLSSSDNRWHIALLRYFNPVGAHPSGLIGEDPKGRPNNLFPVITQVIDGRLPELQIFGDDYDTPDGTGVRDYIHVCDLAGGHLAAVENLGGLGGAHAINLGSGNGHSVREVLEQFQAVLGRSLPHCYVARRPGDAASCYADASRAAELWSWRTTKTLQEMVEDSCRWGGFLK